MNEAEHTYSCGACGRTFAMEDTLLIHMQIHTGETKDMRAVCGKALLKEVKLVKTIKVYCI